MAAIPLPAGRFADGFLRAIRPLRMAAWGVGLYALVYVLAPVQLSYPVDYTALLYIALCYVAFVLGCVVTDGTAAPAGSHSRPEPDISPRLFSWVLALAVFGSVCRLVDVYAIRGFTIGGDLMEARKALESGGGNPFSIAAAVFSPLSYACLFALYTVVPNPSRLVRITTLASFFFPAVDALLKGSRSLVFVNLLMFYFISAFCRRNDWLVKKKFALLFGAFLMSYGLFLVFLWRLSFIMPVELSILRSGYAFTIRPQEWVLFEIQTSGGVEKAGLAMWVVYSQYILHSVAEFMYQFPQMTRDNMWGLFSFYDVVRLVGMIVGVSSVDLAAQYNSVDLRPGVYNTFFGPLISTLGGWARALCSASGSAAAFCTGGACGSRWCSSRFTPTPRSSWS